MSTTAQKPKVSSKTDWKKAKRHYPTLPSGVVVGIEIPDLPNLVKAGAIPNELIDTAISVASGRKPTRDDIEQQAEFYNRLCALTVVEPADITEADFASGDFPFEDKEMLVEFATRQRDLDAIGHHLAGLEKVRDFRNFRGIFGGDEDVESL